MVKESGRVIEFSFHPSKVKKKEKLRHPRMCEEAKEKNPPKKPKSETKTTTTSTTFFSSVHTAIYIKYEERDEQPRKSSSV
jgi:hypothetical protein